VPDPGGELLDSRRVRTDDDGDPAGPHRNARAEPDTCTDADAD